MGSLLAALTTLIVVVLAALLAIPYVLDWNQYKYVFEEQAAKMTGRAVRINGDVDLTILPVPQVRLKGLRVADEAGSFKRPFAEAENFTMILSFPALLSGTIEAREMDLDRPVLRFELDDVGAGNWTTLGAGAGGAFLPARDMVLRNVTIRNGAVEYRGAPDDPASRMEQISGSFAADSFSGPFRFTGFGAIGRDRREIKLSVGRVQNGTTRLKASIGSGTGGSLYQLDGDLKNLTGAMQYSGPVLARLDMGATGATPADKQAAPSRPKAVELRAASTITLQDAKLQDIALTVTENDRPQSFTGSAFAAWGDNPRLDLSVQTTYLDMDQMVGGGGAGGKPNPLNAIAVLPRIFEGWAFEPRSGKIKASIQQANLGGDIIENVTFAASHEREYWQVETLEARLPGDGALSIQGVMRPGDKIGFTGEFNLSGKNLSRLLRWAAPSLGAVDTGDAQQFSLRGGLTYAEDRLTLRKTAGQLGTSTFLGDLSYDFRAESKLVLTLQSERLDLRTLYGGGNPFAAGASQPTAAETEAARAAGKAPKVSVVDAFRTAFAAKQSQFNLNIAQLTMPDFEARDVRSAFRYDSVSGTLDIRDFNLATSEGLSLKADGTLTAFGAAPSGSVNLAVNAPAAASVATLAKVLGLESFSPAARRRIDALAPLRLSGRVIGNRGDKALTMTLAGNAAGSEVTFTGRLDGDPSTLREARVDFGGTIANGDGRRLIAQLAGDAPLPPEASRAPGAGVLTLSARGQMSAGLDSRLELRTPEAEGRFEGLVKPLDAQLGLKGALWLRAGQASTALAMLRLAPGGAPVGGDIDLRATVTKSASKIQIDDVTLSLAGQKIAGSAAMDLTGERPVADIEARASGPVVLPKLAAYLVDWDRPGSAPTTINLTANAPLTENPWPNQSFAFRGIEAVEGKLRLKAPSITLMDGLAIADAQLDASLKARTLRIDALKGQLHGGAFSASATLAATDGRAVLKGNLRLDKADLARLTLTTGPAAKPLARGTADFRLSFGGEGLSPRGLVTVLSGKGRVLMNKGVLQGLQPGVLAQAGDAYLLEEIPQPGKVAARITRELRAPQAQFAYRGFIAPVVLNDGVLEIRRAGFKSPDALATANLLVDLQSMKLDSEWTIGWRGKTRVAASLAPVRMVFAGPLASFTALQAQISTDGFERALSAQRLDREMEKLEKLTPPPSAPLQPSATPVPRDLTVTPAAPIAPATPGGVTHSSVTQTPAVPRAAIPTQPTVAPPQSGAGAQGGQWSADIQDAPRGAAKPAAPAPVTPPASFEDEIRRVLEEQRQKSGQQQAPQPQPGAAAPASRQPPSAPKSSLSYQTQSYSQSPAEYEDEASWDRDAATETAPPPVAVPMPSRRSEPPKQARKPTSPLQDLFGLFQ